MCVIKNRDRDCAALAVNRALIGIAELSLAEKAAKEARFGQFRNTKAILTYYTVYNIMTSYMIISQNIPNKYRNNYKYVDKDLLNSDDESPETWDRHKELEQDLSSLITHGHIKSFCADMRTENIKPNSELDSFMCETFMKKGALLLYNKLCYIRDRAIYRPTFVVSKNGDNEEFAQTSRDVRKEIDSLPDSETIYNVILNYLKFVAKLDNVAFCDLYGRLKHKLVVYGNDEYLRTIGVDEEQKKMLIENGIMSDELEVPTYICQLLELESVDIVVDLYNTFWKPLFEAINPFNRDPQKS